MDNAPYGRDHTGLPIRVPATSEPLTPRPPKAYVAPTCVYQGDSRCSHPMPGAYGDQPERNADEGWRQELKEPIDFNHGGRG